MKHLAKSIRSFIGAKNFEESHHFYRDLGFQEIILSSKMSFFDTAGFGFYLQNAYLKDWIDNTMIVMEIENVKKFWDELRSLNLTSKYNTSDLVPVRKMEWGKECFVHDPADNLWHFGEFNSK